SSTPRCGSSSCPTSWPCWPSSRSNASAAVLRPRPPPRDDLPFGGMRILIVGAGGVGSAVVSIAARRDFYEHIVVADKDLARARRAAAKAGDPSRFSALPVDAANPGELASLARACRADI